MPFTRDNVHLMGCHVLNFAWVLQIHILLMTYALSANYVMVVHGHSEGDECMLLLIARNDQHKVQCTFHTSQHPNFYKRQELETANTITEGHSQTRLAQMMVFHSHKWGMHTLDYHKVGVLR